MRIVVVQALSAPPSGPLRAGLRRMVRWADHVVLVGAVEVSASERIAVVPDADAARTLAARIAPDWILALGDDEFLEADPAEIRARLAGLEGDRATLPRLDYVEPHRIRLDGAWSPGRLCRWSRHDMPPPLDAEAHGDAPHVPIPIHSYRWLLGKNADTAPAPGPSPITKRMPPGRDAKVLITAPIRDAEAFLEAYLDALHRLQYPRANLSFYWLVNDCHDRTLAILQDWKLRHEAEYRGVTVDEIRTDEAVARTPFDSSGAHHWDEPGWRRMCALRTHCMAQIADHDFVLFVDADTVLLPPTVEHLVNLEGVDVLTEIHWTAWEEGKSPLPNVWSSGQYHFAYGFLEALTRTTVHPVGGMGGVVLIPRRVVEAGASYMPIPDLAYHGEDRHFCARVAALGFRLHADTYYPAIHLYRQSVLEAYRRLRG